MSPGASRALSGEFLAPVQATLEAILSRGTDRYGIVRSPIWMSILDAESLESPRDPLPLDEDVRVQRRGRRAPGGSNLFLDQAMLRAAVRLSDRSGEPKYRRGAEAYAEYYLRHFIDRQTGLIEWGPHNFVDAFSDAVEYLEGHYHEIHAWMPYWSFLHQCDPAAIEREVEQIWAWHFNPDTAQFGRHPERGAGCSFAMTGGEFIAAFAFLHRLKGGTGPWLERAKRAAQTHWKARNPDTNLVPNQAEWEDRFDAYTTDTSVAGLWCGRLLAAYGLTRDKEFLSMALAELKAFDLSLWRGTGRPWGQLNLDGSAVPGPRVPIPAGTPSSQIPYACWAPRGELDLWPAYVLGYEFPQETALAYVRAFQLSADPGMKAAALRWAVLYASEEPPLEARGGTYAQHYGMMLSFFCELAQATGDARHLESAKAYARQAVRLLFNGKILRGHPAKPYYEASDGVGFLCYGLVQLQDALEGVFSIEDPTQWNA